MSSRPLVRLARTAALTAACAAALPASASAADCPAQPTTKPFVQIGDQADYFLAPGGDFEGTTLWRLGGGATVRTARKPLDAAGERVLDLPQGAAGTSPAFCTDSDMAHLRFGARASDDDDLLRVETVDARTGEVVELAVLSGAAFEGRWAITPRVLVAETLRLAAGAPRDVELRLTAVRGRWLVDAVLVDPLVRG